MGYGDGPYVSGYNANDNFCFTTDEESCLKIDFILANKTNMNPKTVAAQGLIGLSPEIYENKLNSFIHQLRDHGGIQPIFAMFIPKHWHYDGKITFGGYDLKKYAIKGSTEEDIIWWNLTNN